MRQGWRLRRIICAKMFYFVSCFHKLCKVQMAFNVLAVYDVFAVAIKETVGFQQPQKCGGEKTHKGRSPTGFS